jgi:hypothetical protein
MSHIKNIKLLHQELPACPFIWIYNSFMFPINSICKLTIEDLQLNTELQNVIKKYKCEFYQIEQEVLKIGNAYPGVANISFHSWLFSKFNPSYDDMTNSKLNIQIMSSLRSNNDIKQKGKYGIEINSFGSRRVHIHNNRLSPKYDNAFNLNQSHNSFISICVHEKTGICCVTKHVLIYQ